MKRVLLSAVVVAAVLLAPLALHAAAPVVSSVRASQRPGTKLVDIYYDVADADGDTLTVEIQVSDDNGATYAVPAFTFTGAIGGGVNPGSNRYVVWNAGFDWDGQYSPQTRVRVTAHDGLAPPANMVYVPQGTFSMGGTVNSNEQPIHNVFTNAFFADRFEVTSALYNNVRTWAVANGYTINSGMAAGSSHPIVNVTWYDVVKWCNARSQKDGLTPCYYTDDAQTVIYKSGNVNVTNAQVKWTANGYRLPTEAEWEKAARGGLVQQGYPWGNSITTGDANYSSSGDPFEGGNPPTTPVGYYNGAQTPTGPNRANGYGLYDVAGNVSEWCWDWYGSSYYSDPNAGTNPQGPTTGSDRVLRGGAWDDTTAFLRCGNRDYYGPSSINTVCGFRCVRGL
jgi:formylglycine-generating enzyme required for sulfatase activity